jgi:eukaryotic-like serine/threonine-protein kinase
VPASEVRRRKVDNPSSAFREFGATMVVKGHFRRDNRWVHLKLELIDTRRMREIGFGDIDNQEENLAALQDEAIKTLARLMHLSLREEIGYEEKEGVTAFAY